MSNTRAAQRYARALLSVAEEFKQLEPVSSDFLMLDSMSKQLKEFALFLKSPIINKEKKKLILTEMFKDKVQSTTFLFLMLMTAKGRENILPEIIHQFNLLKDKRMGILNAEARSATQLNDEQQKSLVEQLKKITGKNIRLSMKLDESLIGGMTVQYEDTVIDGSVKHQLESLAKQFSSGSFRN